MVYLETFVTIVLMTTVFVLSNFCYSVEEMSLDISDEENSVDRVDKITQWGEYDEGQSCSNKKKNKTKISHRQKKKKASPSITATEKRLLKDEFYSVMFENFIEGNDKDFDYSLVDNNSEYDNMEIKNLDLEEKYFDSESPEEQGILQENIDDHMNTTSTSSDELDVFMERLNQHSTIQELTKKINKM